MRARRRTLGHGGDDDNYWPSFTDLMSAVALILFVLFLLAYIQNLVAGRNLQAAQARLAGTLGRLETSQRQVTSAEQRLRLLEDQARVAEDRMAQQQTVIADSNRELGGLRAQLEGIALLRVDVLTKVKVALEGELRAGLDATTPAVLVAENGNIVIAESVLFDVSSATVKEAAKPMLRTLARAFATVLTDAKVRENVDVIVVQGHTDERGSASFNRELSAKRASAVLNYVFDANPALERDFGSAFAASAYSEFRPINPAKTEVAYEQNRRIEISVVLKDANVRRVLDAYMQGQSPALGAPDAGR